MPESVNLVHYGDPQNTSKPPSEQRDGSEILATLASGIMGGVIGGVGGMVFREVMAEILGRERSLSWHLEQQLYKFKAMLNDALRDYRIDSLRSQTDAILHHLLQYENAGGIDRIINLTDDVQSAISESRLETIQMAAYKTFLLLGSVQLRVLRQRAEKHNELGVSQNGEFNNIKDTINNVLLPHHEAMFGAWQKRVVDCIHVRDIAHGIPRRAYQFAVLMKRRTFYHDLRSLGVSKESINGYFSATIRGRHNHPDLTYTGGWQHSNQYSDGHGPQYSYDDMHGFDMVYLFPRVEATTVTDEVTRTGNEAWRLRERVFLWAWSFFQNDLNYDEITNMWRLLESKPNRVSW